MLSLSSPAELRCELAKSLQVATPLEACWQLGQQAVDLSTAFFVGYQAAMRCLLPNLPATAWAALAISEKGVKSPFDCRTLASPAQKILEGEKSHVMLANQGLDYIYVLAKFEGSEPAQLQLYKLAAAQVEVGELAKQPFVTALPHYPIRFNLPLSQTELVLEGAHKNANKPFRYWEDVHLLVVYAAWLQGRLVTSDTAISDSLKLLQEQYLASPNYYSLASLDAFATLLEVLNSAAQQLNSNDRQQWQQDSILFKFTQPIRDKIRQRLLTA